MIPTQLSVAARAATTVSALFTAPAQKKRSRDEAAAGRNTGAAGAAPASSDGLADDDAAAEQGPPAKRLANATQPSTHADGTSNKRPPNGGMSTPVSARQPSAGGADVCDGPSTIVAAVSAAAAGVGDGGTGGGGADGGDGSASTPVSLDDLPFPPEHYVATIAELEIHEFPLPLAGAGGELVCPPGYTPTRRKQGAHCDASPQEHGLLWTAATGSLSSTGWLHAGMLLRVQPHHHTVSEACLCLFHVGGPNSNGSVHMVALDCEMCETTEGLALTRITLVDRHGNVRR